MENRTREAIMQQLYLRTIQKRGRSVDYYSLCNDVEKILGQRLSDLDFDCSLMFLLNEGYIRDNLHMDRCFRFIMLTEKGFDLMGKPARFTDALSTAA